MVKSVIAAMRMVVAKKRCKRCGGGCVLQEDDVRRGNYVWHCYSCGHDMPVTEDNGDVMPGGRRAPRKWGEKGIGGTI